MSKTTKLSCNIIKDLLPSYLEDLCTADTKHAVEEHLSECSTCKKPSRVKRADKIFLGTHHNTTKQKK